MKDNPHRYYLAVDEEVVDFEGVINEPRMTSFIALSLFTAMFEDERELLAGLYGLKVLNGAHANPYVQVTKRTGNSKDGYDYEPVNIDILYRRAGKYLSKGAIENFLFENRHKYDILTEFLAGYMRETEGLIRYFEKRVAGIREELKNATGKKNKKDLSENLEKRTNSLRNFVQYSSNIREMLRIIGVMSERRGFFDHELESEYVSRLSAFVQGEVYYVWGSKMTPNYRGLVKLTLRVAEYLDRYPELTRPIGSKGFLNMRIELSKNFREAIFIAKEMSDSSKRVHLSENTTDMDPDSYMFLESEDYERMQGSVNPDSIETDVENLENRKAKFGKL